MPPLTDCVALVTGASRGIGAAVAIELARLGAHVVLTARTQGGLEETDDAIRTFGGGATLLPLDLAEGSQVDAIGPSLHQRFARLDVLVHAAGSLGRLTPVSHILADDWADVTGYAHAAGLGTGPEAAEWAETHKLKFRRDSLAKKRLNPKHLAVMYGAGDSMEPTIRAGDAILFDTSDTTPRHRGIYVLLVPGAGAEEYVVKRALVSKGAVSFVSDNPDGDHNWKEPRPLAVGSGRRE